MERITYGVSGFVDWIARIESGGVTLRVHFTGGALTNYGVTPAEFTTENPVFQKIIESSEYFRKGQITVLRRMETGEAREFTSATASARYEREGDIFDKAEEAAARMGHSVAEDYPTPQQKDYPTPQPEHSPAPQHEEHAAGTEETAPEVVEVSCLTDAQNYLREYFGIPTSRSRSKEKAQDLARENGIVFEGL